MLITAFNRLIRSRVLWGIFAVIVAVCFVGSYSQWGSGCDSDIVNRDRNAAGSLFGASVTHDEIERARFFAMGMNVRSDLNAQQEGLVRDLVWKRLGMLRAAEQMGLQTTDAEVADVIQRDRSFTRNGRFDRSLYERFIQQQRNITTAIFEEFLRQEITLQKMGKLLESSIWIPPTESYQSLQRMTDTFRVDYAVLSVSNVPVQVKVTTNDVARYFAENTEQFREPEKVSVRYVALPISNFIASVQLTADQIQLFYTNNLENYLYTDTNGTAHARPLDEVKAQVESALKSREASELARRDILKFAVLLEPDKRGHRLTFEQAALARGLSVYTTGLFSVDQEVPGVEAGTDFTRSAFALDARDPSGSYSEAVTGSNVVYLLGADRKVETHIPDLAAVLSKVRESAQKDAEEKAFMESVGKTRDIVAKGVESGKSFTDAISAFHPTIVTSATFTAYSVTETDFPYASALIPLVVPLQKGQVSDAAGIKGGCLIAHVRDRQAGDPSAMESARAWYLENMNQYYSRLMDDDWKATILTLASFKDYSAEPVDETGRPLKKTDFQTGAATNSNTGTD